MSDKNKFQALAQNPCSFLQGGTALLITLDRSPNETRGFGRAAEMNLEGQGQVWLPGVPSPEAVRVADVCLQKLCQEFNALPKSAEKPLSSELDDLSLASLLLTVGWGERAPKLTSDYLTECLNQVSDRFWLDVLPWKLALEFCLHNPNLVSGLTELIANLDHHNSSVRGWMLRLEWIVREKIPQQDAAPKLLKNVASVLAYVDESLGLCRALFPTDEVFWEIAGAYQANEYADQYTSRLALAREQVLETFQRNLQIEELRLRQKIYKLALGLTSEEVAII